METGSKPNGSYPYSLRRVGIRAVRSSISSSTARTGPGTTRARTPRAGLRPPVGRDLRVAQAPLELGSVTAHSGGPLPREPREHERVDTRERAIERGRIDARIARDHHRDPRPA